MLHRGTRIFIRRLTSFPCLDKVEKRTEQLKNDQVEPSYSPKRDLKFRKWKTQNLKLDYGRTVDDIQVAYETWGSLNANKSNAILLHTGLSASSHAKSTEANPRPGWWEKFIGPGLAVDTNKFFVVCTNVLGGCYGTTGPSTIRADGERWATDFPIVTLNDIARLQHRFVQSLGITKLYASVGSSMGGMTSLAYATDYPDEVGRVASISGCARSHPSSIALRHVQRQALMSDPNWNRGHYYNDIPPHQGMKLARQFATITYRSGPEWEERFGLDRADPSKPPAFCPDFLIETYLDHQGEKFCLEYDANSLLYISKAMDMFDLGANNAALRAHHRESPPGKQDILPAQPYEEKPDAPKSGSSKLDLIEGMQSMAHLPTFVLGVQSDYLFPVWQQREIYNVLKEADPTNQNLEYVELGYDVSKFGHDTFLLQTKEVGGPLKEFLERPLATSGH